MFSVSWLYLYKIHVINTNKIYYMYISTCSLNQINPIKQLASRLTIKFLEKILLDSTL